MKLNRTTRSFPYASCRTLYFIAHLCILGIALTGIACQSPGGEGSEALPKTIVFDSAQEVATGRIDLTDLSDGFPANWEGLEALVLEYRASSSQRMNLKIISSQSGEDGKPLFSRVLFHPYPKVWTRAAIPISLLAQPPKTGHDMAAVGNRSRPGYFLSLWGPFVPLNQVAAIEFEMVDPIDSPTLEIRAVQVEESSPGDSILEGNPVVDKFGQAVHEEWPGKVTSLAALEQEWQNEETTLTPGPFDYCTYGGYLSTSAKATGFFRVEEVDGKWWFVDPDGHLFLSVGADVIQKRMMTRTKGRTEFFEEMPPVDLLPTYDRDGDPGTSFHTWNLSRRHGEDWPEKWEELTFRRMDAWGLNTVANWSDSSLWDAETKPYVIPLASWLTEISYLGLPDVHSEGFVQAADERAREQCAERKDDPWLVGYFLANEPPFPQKELQTVDLILEGPDSATRQALEAWLEEGDSEERRKEFIDRAFERYVEVTSSAVRRHDPNHLILGMRGGGRPTAAEIRAARAFDVYSVNVYAYEVTPERVKQISELTGKPILIGEFHFGSPARGLAASLVQTRDQKERAKAYRYYVEQAYAQPELIGAHWFQWVDQPSTGRYDGENYNIGLVDVTDRPYEELTEALKTTHQRLFKIHSGQLEPFSERALPN